MHCIKIIRLTKSLLVGIFSLQFGICWTYQRSKCQNLYLFFSSAKATAVKILLTSIAWWEKSRVIMVLRLLAHVIPCKLVTKFFIRGYICENTLLANIIIHLNYKWIYNSWIYNFFYKLISLLISYDQHRTRFAYVLQCLSVNSMYQFRTFSDFP